MSSHLSTRQMLNAELAARAGNKKTKNVLKHHIPQEEQTDLKIDFRCECSNPSCETHVPLTLHQYEKLHYKEDRFVIVKGHEEPVVEKVLKNNKDLMVVEKYAL